MVPKVFPLEKILTVKAERYCESKGKNLREYKLVGIHYSGKSVFGLSEYISKYIPNAEVVVDYQFAVGGVSPNRGDERIIIVAGTALIPKKKRKT